MARPKRNEMAMKDLHRSVQRLVRKRHSHATPKDIELWAFAERGLKVSDESIRKAHEGETDPTACASELLLVLRDFYEAGPGELGRAAEERLTTLARFFGPDRGPDQANRESGCIDGRPAQVLPFRERRSA